MFWFFQNLKKEDREKRWFHFRGTIGKFRYEVASGPSLALELTHGEYGDDRATNLRLGLLVVSIWLTFSLPDRFYFHRKCIATWDGNGEFYLIEGRRYGFYVYEWNVSWNFHAKVMESSSDDPWWMRQYWSIPSLIFGREEVIQDELHPGGENVRFLLGGKEFVFDSIKWIRYRRFRRRIPYSLYRKISTSVDIQISKPPMHLGKGENSWDCGDDGSFGLHGPWKHETPTWENLERSLELAAEYYVTHIMKTVRRYGATSGERGVPKDAEFKYIGRQLVEGVVDVVSRPGRTESGAREEKT